jgi:hypothetical protein
MYDLIDGSLHLDSARVDRGLVTLVNKKSIYLGDGLYFNPSGGEVNGKRFTSNDFGFNDYVTVAFDLAAIAPVGRIAGWGLRAAGLVGKTALKEGASEAIKQATKSYTLQAVEKFGGKLGAEAIEWAGKSAARTAVLESGVKFGTGALAGAGYTGYSWYSGKDVSLSDLAGNMLKGGFAGLGANRWSTAGILAANFASVAVHKYMY